MGSSSDIPAARNAVRVLAFLASQAGPSSAAAIAQRLELPRSTVYHLLAVLSAERFVTHLAEERRYGLGLAALGLGSAYARQAPLTRLARPIVARLVDATGQSAHVAVLHGRELTASGRAILAGLPAGQVRALFPSPATFADRTGTGPRSLRELRELLREVRRRGYATEDGDVTTGLASVAHAAVDHTGRPVAGIALTFLATEVSGERRAQLAAAAGDAAAELSRRLGSRPRTS